MTSREIVRRCIEFDNPPRVAGDFLVQPIQGRTWPITDFGFVTWGPDPAWRPSAPGEDEWGCRRTSFDPSGQDMGQITHHPLAAGWDLLETHPFPDFTIPARYAHLKDAVEKIHAEGKYAYGSIPTMMQLSSDLRGMDQWFVDNLDETDRLGALLELILNARLAIIEQFGNAGMDGVITWDDFGMNDRPLVSPAVFRELWLSRYRRTSDAIHERGMHFIHHCCGEVRPILGMMVEGGCDVLQLDQPSLMGVDWLAENFGGKLCFWNSVDIQRTIPGGDLDALEEDLRHQIECLGAFGGGFMVKAYAQPNAIGMTVAQMERFLEAFRRHGATRKLNP